MAALATTGTPSTELGLTRSLVPQAWEASVRVIGMSECKAAALALSQAFATDEFVQYLLGTEDMAHLTPEKKWQLHVKMMTYIVAAHCLNGVVTTIGPDYDGVALWMPPGRNTDDWWTILRSGMWKLNFQLSAEGRKRYYDLALPLLHRTKAEVLGNRDNDSWYLVYIGTKPSARGRGYAKKLIEHMLQRADAENRAVYLESSAAGNINFYKRFGFQKEREISLERSSPPLKLSIMVREPVSATEATLIMPPKPLVDVNARQAQLA